MKQPGKWSYFSMPLYQRVLLAVTQPLIAVPMFLVAAEIGGGSSETLASSVFGITFSLLIMAPFVKPGPRQLMRIVAVVLGATIIPIAAVHLGDSLFDEPLLLDSEYFAYIFGVTLHCVVLGAVLTIAAPLKTTFRYWASIVGVGAMTGAGLSYYVEHYLCIFKVCPPWYGWMFFPVLAFWSVGFVFAAYFGQIGTRE